LVATMSLLALIPIISFPPSSSPFAKSNTQGVEDDQGLFGVRWKGTEFGSLVHIVGGSTSCSVAIVTYLITTTSIVTRLLGSLPSITIRTHSCQYTALPVGCCRVIQSLKHITSFHLTQTTPLSTIIPPGSYQSPIAPSSCVLPAKYSSGWYSRLRLASLRPLILYATPEHEHYNNADQFYHRVLIRARRRFRLLAEWTGTDGITWAHVRFPSPPLRPSIRLPP